MEYDWRDDLCHCEGRPQHIHCPWGPGMHIHYVNDHGQDITRPADTASCEDRPGEARLRT